MTVKAMQDNMVKKFGLEHPNTIKFFKACERVNDTDLYLSFLYDLLTYDKE